MKTKTAPRLFSSIVLFASALLVGAADVKFQWDSNPEPDIAGYKMYWGLAKGTYTWSTNVGNTTNGVITGLVETNTYYVVVSATNTSGLESDPSNECILFPGPGGFAVASVVKKESVTLTWQASQNTNVTKYFILYGRSTNIVDRLETSVPAGVTTATLVVPTNTTTLYVKLVASVGDQVAGGGFTNASFSTKLNLTWPGRSGNLRRDY